MARRPKREARTPTSEEIATQTAAYLARGGKIKVIPFGVSGEKKTYGYNRKPA